MFDLEGLTPNNDGILVRLMPEYRPATIIEQAVKPGVDCVHDIWATKYNVRWGLVEKVGPGKRNRRTFERIPIDVAPGDIVAFSGMTKAEDGKRVLIAQPDVLVVESGRA